MTDLLEQTCVGVDPMIPQRYGVRRVTRETHDTFTLELKAVEGRRVLPFQPGQFNMVYVFGVGEIPISISGDPSRTGTILHTTRSVGNVTRAMEKLEVGDMIGIRGPYGTPWPVEEAVGNDVVLVAGGIGLAPLRPAIYHIFEHREKYGRVVLLYGTRSPSDILFNKELRQWGGKFDMELHVTVDRGDRRWRGNIGVVTSLIGRAPIDRLNVTAMVCGPEIMMRYTAQELLKRGVPRDQVYVSMERNMKCAIGLCGHCQYGPTFICKDGPVFRLDRVEELMTRREM